MVFFAGFVDRYRDDLGLVLLWIALVAVVGPRGDFPLNDDWAYAANVRHFLDTGRLAFNDWLAMTLVAQVLWGALWAALFGFSHFVLRLSTLFLAGVALLVVYRIVYEETRRRDYARIAAATLLVNPWFCSLSFTFMTDVPFLAAFLLALLFFFRALRAGHWAAIAAGIFFSVLATLIRQFGLLAPLGFGVAWFWKYRHWRALPAAVMPLLLTCLALWGYTRWMEQAYGLPEAWGRPQLLLERLLSAHPFVQFYRRAGVLLWYLGVMVAPVLIWRWRASPAKRSVKVASLLLAALVVTLLAVPAWRQLPWGNLFYNLGLGPTTLKDGYFGINLAPRLPGLGWNILLVGGFATAVLLLRALLIRLAARTAFSSTLPAAWTMLLVYGGYLLFDYYMFDRYLLVATPLLFILLAPRNKEAQGGWPTIGAGLLLGLLGCFSIAATHDYLSWNRARWKLIDGLAARGLTPAQVDGGFEYNATHRAGPRRAISRHGKSWWYVADDPYAITFGSWPCYETTEAQGFQRWLPPARDSLFVLHRPGPSRRDTLYCGAESPADTLFGNLDRRDRTRAFSGRYALQLDGEHAYGFTTLLSDVGPCTRVEISVWRHTAGRGGIVFADPEGDFYEFSDQVARRSGDWAQVRHAITLPPDYPGRTLQVYVWHQSEEAGWYDEWEVGVEG